MATPPKFHELPADVQAKLKAQYPLIHLASEQTPLLNMAMGLTRKSSGGPRRAPEHDEQVRLFAKVLSDPLTGDLPIYAVPNGGQRNKAVAGKLKAEGVRSGVLDVNVDVARGPYHGLRIEMKIKPNKLSDEQVKWAQRLVAQGYKVVVAWSADEAWTAIVEYLALV